MAVYLRNFGADLPEPALDRYRSGGVGFELQATLPGPGQPQAAIIRAAEIWAQVGRGYERTEYAYDLIDHPLGRRRAFHAHDTALFARVGVLVHEHCEELLGHPTCGHYHGVPITSGYEALERLLSLWGRTGPLGCAALTCI